MPLRTIASFAVAIVLGLIAVVLVRNYLTGSQKAIAPSGTGTPVVVAALPIARGAALRPAMFRIVKYPSDAVPAGSFQSLTPLSGNHLALRSITINEPIMADKVSGMGAKTGLSGTLTAGMRAVSVRSNDVAGVGGFALPGDRVDVLVTRTVGTGYDANTVTQVLAENIRVLGVDQSDNAEDGKPVVSKAVTIEVTPDQAQTIQLAQTVGTVALSLRQLADNAALVRRATTVADLGTFRRRSRAEGPAGLSTRKAVKTAGKSKAGPGMTEVRVTRGLEITGYPVVIN